MPTEDAKLAAIFRAILSRSEGTLEEFVLNYMGDRRKAYRFIMDHPIVLDKMHADALIPYVGLIQEDDE